MAAASTVTPVTRSPVSVPGKKVSPAIERKLTAAKCIKTGKTAPQKSRAVFSIVSVISLQNKHAHIIRICCIISHCFPAGKPCHRTPIFF
jgi:hypothetical protein